MKFLNFILKKHDDLSVSAVMFCKQCLAYNIDGSAFPCYP